MHVNIYVHDFTYELKVTNDGNVTLTGVTVNDSKITVTSPAGFDGELSPGEVATFTGSYSITQDDIDAGSVYNAALATGTPPTGPNVTDPGDNTEPLPQNPKIDVEKFVKVSGGTFVDADTPKGPSTLEGSPVEFKFVVTNTGNVTLSNITVTDSDFNLNGLTGDGNTSLAGYQIATLAPNASSDIFFTQASATVGQHTNTGTVTGQGPQAQAVQDADNANYFGISTGGQIAPTGTTCDQYINGTAVNFEDYYAFQGGKIQYNDTNAKPGIINSTNPGVFFYYTGGDGDFKADANGDNLLDPFGVKIDQKNNLNRDDLLFGTVKSDVKLYGVVDSNHSGSLDAGDTCQQIQLTTSNSTLSVINGDVNLQFNPVNIPDQNFEWYVLGVKYDTNTIKGVNFEPADPLAFNTNFETDFNGILETDLGGVNTAYKFA